MSEYQVYNCTARGARYVDKGKPCEDASISSSHDGIYIAAIADGHGDSRCFRSNIGSEIACRNAQRCLDTFATMLREQNGEERMLGREAEKLVDQLFRTLLGRWTSDVLEHLRENPPTEEEYASTDSNTVAIYRAGKELPHIYGTTLIAMLVTEKYALFLHQGDGRCVVLHENGEIDQPVPWDPRCVGRFTASLCDSDVLANWRYHIIDLRSDRIIGCYALSDGIEDSFETLEETNDYIGMLSSEFWNMGRDEYLKILPDHFSALSRNGSRDDASVGCIIDRDAVAPHAERYSLIYEYNVVKLEHKKATERLGSMQRKTAYLTEQLAAAKKNCEQTAASQQEAGSILERIKSALEAARKEFENHSQRKSDAEIALEAAQKEYDDYMALRAQFVEKEASTQQKMDALAAQISAMTPPVKPKNEPASQEMLDEEPIYVQPMGEDLESDEKAGAQVAEDEVAETVDSTPQNEKVQQEENTTPPEDFEA